MRNLFQHYFNPLHIYCRMRQCGLGGQLATRLCTAYERWVYRRLRFARAASESSCTCPWPEC